MFFASRAVRAASSGDKVQITWCALDIVKVTRYTLHTLHCTLHFTLDTPHSTLYISHFTLSTLHSRLYTPRSTLYTLHSTVYTPHFTLRTSHSTNPTSYPTQHSSLNTPLSLDSTLCTPPRSTRHYTPHSTFLTLHCPLYMYTDTPPSSLYTWNSTLYTPHSRLYSKLHTLRFPVHTLHFKHL